MLELLRLREALAIDKRAVARAEIADREMLAFGANHRMRRRHCQVGNHQIVARAFADLRLGLHEFAVIGIAGGQQDAQQGFRRGRSRHDGFTGDFGILAAEDFGNLLRDGRRTGDLRGGFIACRAFGFLQRRLFDFDVEGGVILAQVVAATIAEFLAVACD